MDRSNAARLLEATVAACAFLTAPLPAQEPVSDEQGKAPPSSESAVSINLAAELRLRMESWSSFGLEPDQDDVFLLGRILFGTDLHLGDHIRVYVEARSSLSTKRDLLGGRRPIDADDLGLQNALLDVIFPLGADSKLTARGGRQELSFGKQRLVSPLDWANTQRTFDGAGAIVDAKGLSVQGYWARLVRVRKSDFNKSDNGMDFFGIYATNSLADQSLGFDAYWLALVRDSTSFNGTSGKENRHTLGARVSGTSASSGLEYDVEGSFQFGTLGGERISAFMLASLLAYRFSPVAAVPRLLVGFDFGSGDASAGGPVGTFNQLFPLGHAFLGHADVLGRQNVISPSVSVDLQPLRGLTVALRGYRFWRASVNDALYNAGGVVVRAPGASDSKTVGDELDLTTTYRFAGHFIGQLGYSRFFTGPFIEETGPSDDTGFLYVSITARLPD
jgi:hypothetical protein